MSGELSRVRGGAAEDTRILPVIRVLVQGHGLRMTVTFFTVVRLLHDPCSGWNTDRDL